MASIIGRSKELKEVNRAIEDAGCSKGRFLLVSGGSGVGKTALANWTIDEARSKGWTVMKGKCAGSEEDPYAPMVKAIKGRKGVDIAPVDDMPLNFMPMGLSGMTFDKGADVMTAGIADEELLAQKERLFENITAILEREEEKAPVLLLIEELQKAHEATLQLLFYLAMALRDRRVLLVGTYNDKGVERDTALYLMMDIVRRYEREDIVKDIKLEGLDLDGTFEMIRDIIGTPLDMKFVRRVHTTTDGNPYYINEFMKGLFEQGIVVEDRGFVSDVDPEGIAIPSSIMAVAASRVEDIEGVDMHLLRQCAVLGQEFGYDLLKMAVDLEEDVLVDSLQELLTTGHLVEEESYGEIRYRFEDPLVMEAVLDSLPPDECRDAHRRAALAIEAGPETRRDVFALTHHYVMAGENQKALVYAIRSGEAAMMATAFDDAADYFEKAYTMIRMLEISGWRDRTKVKTSVLLHLGRLMKIKGEQRKALGYYGEIIRSKTTTQKEKAWAYKEIGFIETIRGEFDNAIKAFDRAVEISTNLGDIVGKAEALRGVARVHRYKGDHDGVMEISAGVIAIARNTGNKVLEAEALLTIAVSFGAVLFDYAKADEYLDMAEKLLDPKRHKLLLHKVITNRGASYLGEGRVQEALECFERAEDLAKELGYMRGLAVVFLNISTCYSKMEKFKRARGELQKALDIFMKLENYDAVIECIQNMGVIEREMGRFEQAAGLFRKAIEKAEEKDLFYRLGETLIEYGRCLRLMGEEEQAVTSFQRAVEITSNIGNEALLEQARKELGP